MKTILVVGPSVPQYLHHRKDICIRHEPCVLLQKIPYDKNLLTEISHADGLIFTSKQACVFLAEDFPPPIEGVCFCIGEETARAVKETFTQAKIVLAPHPTQEGVIECIKNYTQKEPLQTLLWPKSKAARQKLSLALAPIRVIDCDLYAPLPITHTYSFDGVDEILFTCPSSVDAFFSCIDRKEIPHISLSAIGPITLAKINGSVISC